MACEETGGRALPRSRLLRHSKIQTSRSPAIDLTTYARPRRPPCHWLRACESLLLPDRGSPLPPQVALSQPHRRTQLQSAYPSVATFRLAPWRHLDHRRRQVLSGRRIASSHLEL